LSGAEEDVGLRGSSLIYLLAKEEGRGKEGRCMSALFFILFIFIYFYFYFFAALAGYCLRVGFHVRFIVYLLAWFSLDVLGV
jgi:hypothetical protein